MTNVYRQRLSGPSSAANTVVYTLATRPTFGIIGRIIYLSDTGTAQLDIGTAWVDLGSVAGGGLFTTNTLQSISAAGIIPTGAFNRQITPVVGNGGAVTTNLTTAIAAGQAGWEHTLIGTDDTNTVSLDPATANLVLNGPITLYNGTEISFVYYNSKWLETSRSI